MKKDFVVIGLGRFGSTVARQLCKMNYDVLAIDINKESVRSIANDVINCVIADSTKIDVLEELDIRKINHAVVAIGNNLQASILTVVNLKKLGVQRITVRADEEGHKEVFTMLGADEVIIPEEASAISLANQILSDSILDYYPIAKDHAMVKTSVGPNFKPQTLMELNLRNMFDVNIVGIMKEGKFRIPHASDYLEPGDIVVVVGTKSKLNKLDLFLRD